MKKCSVIQEIQKQEVTIKICYEKVKILEDKLKKRNLPPEQTKDFEKELKEAKKLLETNRELLSALHGDNRQSFMLASAMFFVIFLVYGLYLMFGGYEY